MGVGRKPGGPKYGGRQAGTPNKRRSILEVCESIGLDPFVAMAQIAQDKEHPRSFEALKELCQYIEPKKKALEHSVDEEKGFRIVVEDYRKKDS